MSCSRARYHFLQILFHRSYDSVDHFYEGAGGKFIRMIAVILRDSFSDWDTDGH